MGSEVPEISGRVPECDAEQAREFLLAHATVIGKALKMFRTRTGASAVRTADKEDMDEARRAVLLDTYTRAATDAQVALVALDAIAPEVEVDPEVMERFIAGDRELFPDAFGPDGELRD